MADTDPVANSLQMSFARPENEQFPKDPDIVLRMDGSIQFNNGYKPDTACQDFWAYLTKFVGYPSPVDDDFFTRWAKELVGEEKSGFIAIALKRAHGLGRATK